MLFLDGLEVKITGSEECKSPSVNRLRQHEPGSCRDTTHRCLGKNPVAMGGVLGLSHGNRDSIAHKCPCNNVAGKVQCLVDEMLQLVDPIEQKMVQLEVPPPAQVGTDPLQKFRETILLLRNLKQEQGGSERPRHK